MNFEDGAKSVVLPAGAYIVGDPCYHVPDSQWDRVLDESDFFDGQCHATFKTYDGRVGTVIAFGTAYGDGVYNDEAGRQYGVDAGLIGIIPVLDIDPSKFDDTLAHAIRFTSPVHCSEKAGTIRFGHITIVTDESDEDSEQEDSYFFGDDNF